MDNEFKEMLMKILEGQEELKVRFNGLENETKKNTMILEEVQTDIKTIAEVQKNHINQNEKQHEEILKIVNEKNDIVCLATKELAKDLSEIKSKFDKVERVTKENTYDLAYLKTAK
jgi:chlorite dismutase